jgi:hypothetical protein
VGAVSIGKPGGAHVDHPGIMERDDGQQRQVCGYRHSYRTMASESRSHGLKIRGLKASEHAPTSLPD